MGHVVLVPQIGFMLVLIIIFGFAGVSLLDIFPQLPFLDEFLYLLL